MSDQLTDQTRPALECGANHLSIVVERCFVADWPDSRVELRPHRRTGQV